MKSKLEKMDGITTRELHGEIIGHVFELAPTIGELHQIVTSPTGDYFHFRLLQKLRRAMSYKDIQEMAKEAGLKETQRHFHKLLSFKLVEKVDNDNYKRTELGEDVVNRVRELEKKIGKNEAEKIYKAEFGRYSIELFLVVYGHKKHFSFLNEIFDTGKRLEIKYKPSRIGRMAQFLPRTAEAIAAIDRLDEAGILVYKDDGYVHLHAEKARSFYQYLKRLYEIVLKI